MQFSTFLVYRLLLQSSIHTHECFFLFDAWLFDAGETSCCDICVQQIHSHGVRRAQLHNSGYGAMRDNTLCVGVGIEMKQRAHTVSSWSNLFGDVQPKLHSARSASLSESIVGIISETT